MWSLFPSDYDQRLAPTDSATGNHHNQGLDLG